jgi:hypothetical protein
MKVPCIIKPVVFLVLVALSIIFFAKNLDSLFGGHDNCFVCTKLNYNGYLTNWSISHFVVFAISGYLCPNNIYALMIIGIIWEILELILEYNSKINNQGFLCKNIMPHCDTKNISKKEFWDHYLGYNNNKLVLFWCSGGLNGTLSDIVFDVLGIYLGRYLAIHR